MKGKHGAEAERRKEAAAVAARIVGLESQLAKSKADNDALSEALDLIRRTTATEIERLKAQAEHGSSDRCARLEEQLQEATADRLGLRAELEALNRRHAATLKTIAGTLTASGVANSGIEALEAMIGRRIDETGLGIQVEDDQWRRALEQKRRAK